MSEPRVINIKITMTPKRPADEMQKFVENFGAEMAITHRSSVNKILECCAAWCRVDTGRLRSGFFAYMKRYQHPYVRSLTDTGAVDPKQVALGESEGEVNIDDPLHTMITNAVKYGIYVEQNVGIFNTGIALTKVSGASAVRSPYPGFDSAHPKFIELYSKSMDTFLANAAQAFKEGKEVKGITDFGPPMVTE